MQKLKKGFKEDYKQFYGNLDAIKSDRDIFKMLTTQHGFEHDELRILMEPRMKELMAILKELNQLFKSLPQETILALSCFASHGMIQDGRQVILLNEFVSSKGFYKIFGVEENIRMMA